MRRSRSPELFTKRRPHGASPPKTSLRTTSRCRIRLWPGAEKDHGQPRPAARPVAAVPTAPAVPSAARLLSARQTSFAGPPDAWPDGRPPGRGAQGWSWSVPRRQRTPHPRRAKTPRPENLPPPDHPSHDQLATSDPRAESFTLPQPKSRAAPPPTLPCNHHENDPRTRPTSVRQT